jgi:aminoglycoside 3-N-acetyltransferase
VDRRDRRGGPHLARRGRSDHPGLLRRARQARAAIAQGHRLDDALGEQSPPGAIYRLNGKVLLLGCGHDSNSSLHLAERRQASPPRGVTGSSVRYPDGTTGWLTWVDVIADEGDFERLGAALDATGAVAVGQVGAAGARLMSQRAIVDFATAWMATHRTA